MKMVYEYGSPASSSVLIQMVDDHDLDLIDNEVSLDKAYGSSRKYTDFQYIRQICIRIRSAGCTILRLSIPSYTFLVSRE